MNAREQKRWKNWFFGLKPGDAVLMQFPWQDGERAGGRIVKARVGRRHPLPDCRFFSYRLRDGRRRTIGLGSWAGDCYNHVMPLNFELVYDDGYHMIRRRPGWHRKKIN
jgi:hypothetical protein